MKRVYCVLGKPISHSLSPALHNELFRQSDLEATYVAFETENAEGAANAMRTLGIAGASVTLPLKVDMMQWVDEQDDSAMRAGALNTIYLREEKLVGANTDMDGFSSLVERVAVDPSGETVLCLGAGGAARVVARVLLEKKPARFLVAVRDLEKGEKFLEMLRGLPGNPAEGVELEMVLWEADKPFATKQPAALVVNSTPIGMFPGHQATPLDLDASAKVESVIDLIYNPVKTRLVREAEMRGIPAEGGMEMFAVQAARQFELWTGKEMNPSLVRWTLRERIGGVE